MVKVHPASITLEDRRKSFLAKFGAKNARWYATAALNLTVLNILDK
jgi:hypothetical protein